MELMELIRLGGPVVVVLIAMSVFGLAVVLYKLLQYERYSRAKLNKTTKAVDAWIGGDSQQALALLATVKTPHAQLLRHGMNWIAAGNRDENTIREELTRQGQRIVTQVNSLNSLVEQVAYLSPMLGLLGTVLGMVSVFQGVASQSGGADSGMLAGGIWEALLTTVVGLVVAIPFSLIHSLLESRATTIRRSLEDQLTRLFTVNLYQ
ncbi:MAG: MotA/TolQ/ExbB proton channel family protein [Porticoccaceae bacterium]